MLRNMLTYTVLLVKLFTAPISEKIMKACIVYMHIKNKFVVYISQ